MLNYKLKTTKPFSTFSQPLPLKMDQMNRMLDFARNPYPAELDSKIFFSHDNANRTVFLADLPKGTSYIEISDFFENKVGFTPSQISIKR